MGLTNGVISYVVVDLNPWQTSVTFRKQFKLHDSLHISSCITRKYMQFSSNHVTVNMVTVDLRTWGGGGGAQSNFPTRDHQNIFNLILTYIFIFYF